MTLFHLHGQEGDAIGYVTLDSHSGGWPNHLTADQTETRLEKLYCSKPIQSKTESGNEFLMKNRKFSQVSLQVKVLLKTVVLTLLPFPHLRKACDLICLSK